MDSKLTYYVKMEDESGTYWGECGILPGLSIDDRPDYEERLSQACNEMEKNGEVPENLERFPSIQFGLEQLYLTRKHQTPFFLFDNDFYNQKESIPINGLIWMGKEDFLRKQIHDKIDKGFHCIKLKIGALDWEVEMEVLKLIRKIGGQNLIMRVDANGAWNSYDAAMKKMEDLHTLSIHSIEQPLKVGLNKDMALLCQDSPVPIAFDEELFEHTNFTSKKTLLSQLQPQYIVLKPSLTGGFKGCDDWIKVAEELDIGYWLTSALESNIGLNAISQYTFDHNIGMHQGLGTGQLYSNNIESPLVLKGENLWYDRKLSWDSPAS